MKYILVNKFEIYGEKNGRIKLYYCCNTCENKDNSFYGCSKVNECYNGFSFYSPNPEMKSNTNEKIKAYCLEHWQEYNLTDTKKDFVALINILESQNETLDSLHDVALNGYTEFCGIWGSRWETDRDVVNTLFDYHQFFTNQDELNEVMKENATECDCTVDEYLELEDIRRTSDGIIRVLHY